MFRWISAAVELKLQKKKKIKKNEKQPDSFINKDDIKMEFTRKGGGRPLTFIHHRNLNPINSFEDIHVEVIARIILDNHNQLKSRWNENGG